MCWKRKRTAGKEARRKYAAMLEALKATGGAAVAFSGGVDSTLLLYAAKEALGEGCVAVTARSAFFPEAEAAEAAELCTRFGVKQITLDVDVLAVPGVAENPPDRCYLCKRALLGAVCDAAARRGISCVAEGSNVDDDSDWRPGARAVRELGVRSPLKEAGLTKAEIRALSRQFGLPTAEKPSMACLASRIPSGERITPEDLRRVETAEEYLGGMGLTQRRVRVHGDVARIEALPEEFPLLLRHADAVDARLRALGFRFVSMDLGGYRTGSVNGKQ